MFEMYAVVSEGGRTNVLQVEKRLVEFGGGRVGLGITKLEAKRVMVSKLSSL